MAITDNELRHWLAITFIKDIGPITIKKLLSAFRTLKNILAASLKELQQVEDIKASRTWAIHEFDSWDLVDQELVNGVRVLRKSERSLRRQ